MYFKDNSASLSSGKLLLWFIIIPLLTVGIIFSLSHWQKKIKSKEEDPKIRAIPLEETEKQPDSYGFFVSSSLSLPEGTSWSEIYNNTNDLTEISDSLYNIDNLPLLIKPIKYIDDDLDWFTDTDIDSTNNLNKRLASLINEVIKLNDEALQHFTVYYETLQLKDSKLENMAVSVHPEWQQQYIANTQEDTTYSSAVSPAQGRLGEITIFLVLPPHLDADFVATHIRDQLISYMIPAHLLHFINIVSEESDDFAPVDELFKQIQLLSTSHQAQTFFLFGVDLQIDESWLDSHPITNASNIVPSEAVIMHLFYNHATKDLLELTPHQSVSLTSFELDDTINKRSRLGHTLTKIQSYLMHQWISEEKTALTKPLENRSVQILTDINPIKQPYDLTLINKLADEMTMKGALANEYFLGHYMPLNSSMKTLLSLGLFLIHDDTSEQELDMKLLITQHQRCCLLWQKSALINL